MAWNGTGTFSRLYNWVTDRDAGIKIQATRMDGEDDGFATGINNCMAKDGQNAATANLNMGGFRMTNAGNATARTDLVTAAQIQDGGTRYAVSTGTNTIAVTLTPAVTAYANGQAFFFKAANTTTSTSTLAFNGLTGLKTYFPDGTTRCPGGEIIQNNVYMAIYNSSLDSAAGGFVIVNHSPIVSSFTGTGVGFTSTAPTETYNYTRHGNYIFISGSTSAGLSGTSSSTSFSITGLPTILVPTATRYGMIVALDNTTGTFARCSIDSSGVWTLINAASASATSWTAAGTKAFRGGTINYAI